jgi:hypothetical protein
VSAHCSIVFTPESGTPPNVEDVSCRTGEGQGKAAVRTAMTLGHGPSKNSRRRTFRGRVSAWAQSDAAMKNTSRVSFPSTPGMDARAANRAGKQARFHSSSAAAVMRSPTEVRSQPSTYVFTAGAFRPHSRGISLQRMSLGFSKTARVRWTARPRRSGGPRLEDR